jgi:hypothetical protein
VTARYRGKAKQRIANKQMNTRQITIALAAIAVAGIWFGRLAWRAHHNLVTLHVRNMPLGEVVSALERQTWENIKFDRTINARISLNVEDAPLSRVLDLVADRAGARWQKNFAVGASDGAMAKLESVLAGATKLDAAGWTNLAPRFSELALENPPGRIVSQNSIGGGAAPEHIEGKPGLILHRALLPSGGSSGGGSDEGGGAQMFALLPDGTTDQWSSERLVLESSLLPLLGPALPSEATGETAARVASTVHGRMRLYYALEKSPFEMGPVAGGRRTLSGPPKPGFEHAAPGDAVANMAQMSRQRRLRELGRSPEEQVERARQDGASRTQLETRLENN